MVTTNPSHPPLLKRSKLWMACTRNRWVLLSTEWIIASQNSVLCVIIVWLCNWKLCHFRWWWAMLTPWLLLGKTRSRRKKRSRSFPNTTRAHSDWHHSHFLQGLFFMECLCSLGHLGNHSLVGMGLFIFPLFLDIILHFRKTSHMLDKSMKEVALTDLSRLGRFRMLIVALHACFIFTTEPATTQSTRIPLDPSLYLYIPNGSISQILLFIFP